MDLETLSLVGKLLNSQEATGSKDTTLMESLKEVLALPLNSPQAMRAHTSAKERLELLNSLPTHLEQFTELRRLKHSEEGMLRWFRLWMWSADPRPDAATFSVPFVPFEFQEEGLRWLWDLVYNKKEDGLVEKSRDMGLSWLLCGFAVYNWLFSEKGRPFNCLFGSRKEMYVDTRGDLSSLFEKLRFMINRVPEWMLPKGFNAREHSTYMRIVNPHTGSLITGESSNDGFGRGGRQTMIVNDEFAFYPSGGYAAWTSSSESTRTRLAISTPHGRNNKFADLRFSPTMNVKSFHWTLHPWKDQEWYENQKKRMHQAEIAQELDLNYEGSLPGRLFPMFSELHHVITWQEFAEVIGNDAVTRNRDSGAIRYHIPRHWTIGVAMDVGTTIQHPNVCIWAATASQDSPLAGSVFLYRQFVVAEGAYPGMVGPAIKELMAEDNELARASLMVMSHEAASERLAYNYEHELPFTTWKTELGYTQGIAQIQDYLAPDKLQPHPFRPKLNGRPRLFIIVDEAEGNLIEAENGCVVAAAVTDKGFKRLRDELPQYHIPESEAGKPAKMQRPFKLMDDAVDCVRALAAQYFPVIQELNRAQELDKKLPSLFRQDNIKNTIMTGGNAAIHAYTDYLSEARRELDEEDSYCYYEVGR